MRWTREEYLELMTFGRTERPMFSELFGPLIGLEAEWRAQGASPDEISLQAFDWDYVEFIHCGGLTWAAITPPVVIEESNELLIARDYLGRTTKLCKGTATVPLPMDFPVKCMDDWLKVKPLFAYRDDRINWDQVEIAKARQAKGTLVTAGIPGAFDMPRDLMGEEVACLAYYDQPELMADVIKTISDTSFRVLEQISRTLTIDHLWVHEDFAGRSGPLVGPTQIDEYFRPYYRRIWDMLASRGSRVFAQDTDGNIESVLDSLLECGLTASFPVEPAAGMDMVRIRRKYGKRLAMKGGIDKHVLRQDKTAIRRELEYKMQPLMREGGVVFGLDHRIPNGTPLDNYRYYVDLGREILGLPARSPERRGWGPMSF